MGTTSAVQQTRVRRSVAIVAATLALLALVVVLAGGDGDDRVGLRSGAPTAAPEGVAPTTEPAPSTTSTTSTTTTTTTTAVTEPVPPTAVPNEPAAPPPTEPVAPPTTTTTTPAAPTTGTMRIELEPATDGGSTRTWVSGPDSSAVLPPTEVTGPIVIEGLAPGTYDVFVERTGAPSGPDEDGVELGGGSSIARRPVDVHAGATTTFACADC